MTPFLRDDIKAAEGLRLRAYPDPASGAAPWTIGYGHCGLEVHPGLEWTADQAEAALTADIARAIDLLDRRVSWWRALNHPREDVLVQMMFNMGWGDGQHGLSTFRHALAHIDAGRFDAAADDMLASEWARQVKGRAQRLADQMRTGVRVSVAA